MHIITSRRVALGIATLTASITGLVLMAAPANAEAYRYWSYWQGASDAWVAAQTGPGGYDLIDKDVQGWRFGITTGAPSHTPDNAAGFAVLCPDLAAAEAPAGQLRVAVVIDSGFAADAPEGQTPPADQVDCVTVPEGSTGNQALEAATEVTKQGELVCSLGGYPQGECSPEVSDSVAAAASQAAATESPNPAVIADSSSDAPTETDGPPPALLLSVGALAVIGVVALVVSRRRRGGTESPSGSSSGS